MLDDLRSNFQRTLITPHHLSLINSLPTIHQPPLPQQVAQHLALLAKDTPLFDKTGQLPDAEHPSDKVLSYLSIQEGVSGKAKMYCQKYAQFVIDYAIEWEKVVSSRVNKGLKTAEQLRVELDHYQRKVESLRQAANATMAKGKQVDAKTADKLTRNEDKLGKCRDTHAQFVRSLCILMDEVTDRSWRDLHPLLIKIAQFEVTLSGDEAKALSSLNSIVNELKRVAVTHGIKPQARLKDLDSMDPSILSTRAPGSNTLAIEAGVDGMSLSGSSNDIWSPGGGLTSPAASNQRLPPGSVGPQGMGGFPVAVQSSMDNFSVGAGSTTSAPSTLDMLSINASAAPAPTVDMLTAAFGPSDTATSSSIVATPTGGGYNNYSRQQSSGSFDTFDSAYSGASGTSAPPPAAPPPPPPSQFGAAGAANPNPFGSPAPAPATYGAPSPSSYGGGAPNPFGTPPPAPSSYGQQPSYYGNTSAPPTYNQGYGQQQQQQQQQYPAMQQAPQSGGYGQYVQPSPSSYGQPAQSQGRNPFE